MRAHDVLLRHGPPGLILASFGVLAFVFPALHEAAAQEDSAVEWLTFGAFAEAVLPFALAAAGFALTGAGGPVGQRGQDRGRRPRDRRARLGAWRGGDAPPAEEAARGAQAALGGAPRGYLREELGEALDAVACAGVPDDPERRR